MKVGSTGKREGGNRYRSRTGLSGGERFSLEGKGFVLDICGRNLILMLRY